MQQPPYQQMAREFMDLWQKQVASVMSDKEFIRAMLDIVQTMQSPHAAATATASASDPSPAVDADAGLLAQLAFRMEMCERRLADLEARKNPAAKRKAQKRTGRGSKKPRR
ncbi:MAG: hypothetical protein KGI29_01440 [Pseudomonadota bacterium]|nr:hypothetical protein [Pseudomonadota bacterium]MDE3037911.1 hypothetical protein [Pseudomonadota bacterium]